MLSFLRNILHPARYHGRLHNQRPPFFEGWYFKVIDATERYRFSFIPGIFWSGRPHSFVQVLDGHAGSATYHEFPVESFRTVEDRFLIHVSGSRFTLEEMSLLIEHPNQRISGTLKFDGAVPWPVTLTSPGIMGWYAWVPFMECYHGVLSLDHAIQGVLTVGDQEIDFSGGRGYIEKDWGRAFPKAWIWFQTNHFDIVGTSLTGSIAIIPWLRTSFPGFIIGFWHEARLYRFATYTGATIERLAVTDTTIEWIVGNKDHRLEMFVTRGEDSQVGLLKGPDIAEMGKRVAETLSATVEVRLTGRLGGRVLFQGAGRHAGLEVHEVESRLLKMVEVNH